MLLLIGAVNVGYAQGVESKVKVKIYGNVYGGGELSQVVAKDDALDNQLVTDSKLNSEEGGLFHKDMEHSYTTKVKLSTGAEIFGKVFGGGQGKEGGDDVVAGLVTGQTDVVLDGANTWERIFGGGEMADISGNTLVHFKKGKMAHDAFGGGLGKVTQTMDSDGKTILPDNRQTVLASADIKKITGKELTTGNTFVVFDGEDGNHTEYEYKILKTYEVVDGKISEFTQNQFDASRETQLFLTDHNIYGGGMTAANVAGNTFTHINYGMVSEGMLNETYLDGMKQWDIVYNSIANAQFCVFGGGYGYHAQVNGDTNVTMDIEGSHSFRYLSQFKSSFSSIWDGVNPDPNVIYDAAERATWSHGAPGRSCMDVVGGGYNGKVVGSTNVTIGGDVVVRKVYGGGYYASVGETNVTLKSGLFNRIYGGGLIGNVYGKANLTYGQQGTSDDIKAHNGQLLVKSAIYGGNDISGTVGTEVVDTHSIAGTSLTYNIYSPKDDADHGVRMNIYGGLVLGDVYGAGNGNHTGYTNPEHIQFSLSQHPSENYRQMQKPGQENPAVTAPVYKYRPRTAHVVMNLQGNEGSDFNDGQNVDKVRIWGRTFGGGNSCNVGIWDGKKDDNAEVYSDNDATSWHPGNNFLGGGTIEINIGSHVQLGNRNDSHDAPNGLFMGSNGQEMVTQSTKPDELEYYHHYFNPRSHTYLPGFLVYDADGNDIGRKAGLKSFSDFINNILTWSDDVKLNISDEAQDIWMSNFVGGGYRGSMKAMTKNGSFYYKLPKGVTVGHAVVGGSYNAHIVYRIYETDEHGYKQDSQGNYIFQTEIPGGWVKDNGTNNGQYLKELYEDADQPDQITGILRYNFDGGMLAMSSGLNAEDNTSNTRIHQIHNPSSLETADFTCDGGYFGKKEKALVRLELKNRLHPAVHEANPTAGTELNVHGGIVYGGCYMTGYVEGDSWVDYDCSLSPLCTDERFFGKTNKAIYDEVADLNRNNALNVFGAGYGTDTHSMGDVYLCVQTSGGDTSSENGDWPFIYNVFGGGNMGTVAGSTNVYYDGGKQGTMLGSLYGGGFKGDIDGNTYVELVQGFLVNVYGGSRQANIGGAAHVWAYDGSTRESTGLKDKFSHLIICNMYGGNDISGTISGTMPATWTKTAWPALEGKNFNSYIQVSGTNPGVTGFPLVGNVYGGGNGEQWSEELGVAPNVGTSLLEIDGGTTLEAFGGGNKATITDEAYIFINASGEYYADVQFTEYQKGILDDKFFKTVRDGYTWNGTELKMSAHHVDNLFGGNNVATMTIQPKWNLKQGRVGNVYSGGNMGDMTYYNPVADTDNGEPKGLSIEVNSEDIYIESLYGGCRMSDVKAMDGESSVTFEEDEYGATVNVIKGHIGNVYGGNDISGYVYNGTNVNLSGSITGNVYGAGNGNYLYAYDKTGEHVTSGIAEVWNNDVNKFVYWIPGAEGDSQLKQLVSLTNARPHVAKAYLNIQGQDAANKVYISGSIYCGGNASTIRSTGQETGDAHVKFNIGNNVIVNEVFMGSNGESMRYDANDKDNTYLTNFEKVNGLDFSADMTDPEWNELLAMYSLPADTKELIKTIYPNLLSVYMSAVDMKAMPLGFTEFSGHTFQNTWIGTFCMGGNAGSMMTDQPVDIVFPQSLNFFGRIIGGSKDASFQYKGKWHRGGFRMPLASGATLKDDSGVDQPTKTKLRMKIRGDWYSRRMVLGDEYKEYRETYKAQDYLAPDKTDDGVTWKVDGKAWHDGCNVYGGCYQSGDMVGDVQIYIESDMLAYSDPRYGTTIDAYTNTELDESNRLNLPVANVYGAGYGPESRSFGDAYIYMKDIPNVAAHHPSVNNIFGGGRNGMLVGNSVIHVHDGLVYKDVVGGSFAAPMYGSAQITVGYPKFYVCKQSGEYFIDRADKWNEGYMTKGKNGAESVIKKSIKYFEGTYVPCNVYDQITGVKLHGSETITPLSSIHTDIRQDNEYFAFHDEGKDDSFFPTGGWNSVEIRVRGGVYGGGFSLSNSTAAIAGSYTTLASTTEYNHGVDSKGNSSVGYGGNSSIIVSDQGTTKDHIKISTENPVVNGHYSGTGGIYGDGRLVFCEGFRAAELNGYGYAQHTPSNPLMLNSLQRLDLLTVNDCCFKLYGDEDFATDEINKRKYSLARIGELRMNSTIDATGTYATDFTTKQSRNYIGFYNTIHYIGAIVTNDDFRTDKFHDYAGKVGTVSYREKKQEYITNYYNSDKLEAATNTFKQRNYATARNMIGINSGFSLHVENQYYEGDEHKSYYGPIVGVAEVKLLNVQPGEGGGYVYADNVHADTYDKDHPETATFMNESGNFVFEGVIRPGEDAKQYIVDDCLPKGFDECGGTLPEQHYWYVIGDTYYYHATLTAFSFKTKKEFDLSTADPNVIFAGIENDWEVSLQSVKWQAATYPEGYTGDIRGGRDEYLTPLSGSDVKYKFTLQVGDNANDQPLWTNEMPRSTTDTEQITSPTWTTYNNTNTTPRFNVHLIDNVDNCPLNHEEEYYNNYLSVPENVQLIIQARKQDGTTAGGDLTYETKTYNVTLEIVYIQGPSFTGNVNIMNCALPGERIGFNSNDIQIKTTDQLPVTGFDWKLVPLKDDLSEDTYSWDESKGKIIPASFTTTNAEGYSQGSIPALYSQNHWNVYYVFRAGGEDFVVAPTTTDTEPLNKRMLVVHNYHKMADIVDTNYDVTLSKTDGNIYAKALKPGAMIYLADDDDIAAFVSYVNDGNTGEGMHFFLQNDLTLPVAITGTFAGTLHGNGYSLSLPSNAGSLFGNNLTGYVYNLGVPNGTIASTGTITNSFSTADDADVLKYGKKAYALSHYYSTENDPNNYVHTLFANNDGMGGDWRYALTSGINSRYLRIAAPNYGNMQTSHNAEHADEYKLIRHDCLFFGQTLNPTAEKKYPEHIDEEFSVNSWTEANRVYRTTGYYHSSTPDKFHYNKVAWAMQPTLTAIDFTADNPETTAAGNFYGKTDDRPESLSSFNSDHNGTVSPYSNETTNKVSQNLLVYNNDNGGAVFKFKDLSTTTESDVQYHNIVKDGSGNFATDYFHLVDKQCFNAPITFNVKNRAWYERMPKYFRNVSGTGESYANPTAWEGICLPFTATKVTASVNGEITHFYGNNATETIGGVVYDVSELHHEYWLNGMTAYDNTNHTATFMRPAKEGSGLFTESSQKIASDPGYVFKNTYFTGLSQYIPDSNTRDDVQWYNESHTYKDYVYLTAGVPYIISFPGNDFYEFSLEGTEYDRASHTKSGAPQKITFDGGTTTILVSDEEMKPTASKHYGTYMHTTNVLGMNGTGSKFETSNDALPFRTYMKGSVDPQTRSILIMDPYLADLMEEETESPEDELGEDYLRIWSEGRDIVIETSEARNFNLYRHDGTYRGTLHCSAGLNRFSQEVEGIYLVGGEKLLVK
ncbi:MAG: hypothetical protein MJZ27_10365 [Bacteroidales bacterium]|nr:hypothetical protein [Bacteroidales bacterium]